MGEVSGSLSVYFYEAVILTVPVSLILLLWYRRTVTRSMLGQASGENAALDGVPATGPWQDQTESDGVDVARSGLNTQMPDSVRLRIAVIYTLAGMTASAVITGLLFVWGGLETSALGIFTFWYTYCWPIIPTLAALLVVPLRKALLAV